jgi:predicted ATPase/class 3 adenylate cyclase
MPPPTGTITFLFTDIAGSSRLWERFPVDMRRSLARHDEIVRTAVAANEGFVFKTVGDAFCVAFDTAVDALRAAADTQTALAGEPWEKTGPLAVRMALHVGAAELRDNDYFGDALNRVSRILAGAHGEQTLLSLPVEALVRDHLPAAVALRDLGEHRLRGLDRPEHLYQLVLDGHRRDFPPLQTLIATPTNLPTNLSSFVGRERPVAEVRGLLGQSRLLTLTGTGGTGKTRLSLEVAAQVLDDHPDGVFFVELATLTDPQRVWETVAGAIGIREEADYPLRRTLIRFLEKRDLLLILDNCEHLLGECAALATDLVAACPHLRILATSRTPLGISGERTWAVPPLTVLDPARDLFQVPDLVATVSQYEAVRLFIDRAAAAKPGFAVDKRNAPAIAQICWRLDGIPLAIELAAARARVLSAEQIASRLDDRFRLLTGGNRSVLPHQQTLRTLIDWSYDLLSEAERVLFRRLGAFGGGRTIDGIEAVCTGDGVDKFDAIDLLQQLVDKSLLAVESDPDLGDRYTMIESVWQYAQDKLRESGESETLQNRHLDYFLALAEEARPGLEGPDVSAWLERVDTERGNFRLAFDWAVRTPENAGKGLVLAGSLVRYFEIRGNLVEARKVFDRVLAAPGAQGSGLARAAALSGAGRIAWCQDRTDDASQLYASAGALYEQCGQTVPAALNRAFLGFMERNTGDLDAAEARFSASYRTGTETGNLLLAGISLSGLGTIASDRGDATTSRRLKEESLALFRALGDSWIVGYNLWGVARACVAGGDTAAARRALVEWVEIARNLGNRWALPYVMKILADVLLLEGEPAATARLFGAAESAREALGITLDPADQAELDSSLERLRAATDAEVIKREWALGYQTQVWQAIDFALRPPLAAAA